MTVMIPVPMKFNRSSQDDQIYLETYFDTDQIRFHFMTVHGHIDGYYIFSFDKETFNEGEFHSLKLWTSIKSSMKDMDLIGGRSQLKIIGVDICEEL